MNSFEQNFTNWRSSLVMSVPISGLISRNATAYKWKAAGNCWILREAVFWRASDLLFQSYALHQQGHGLGARILLRSGYETLASLVYLNENILAVIECNLDFFEFSKLVFRQVAGSKSEPKHAEAINVLTTLDKAEKRYPGIRKIYDILCESAHPNYEGLVGGYSEIVSNAYEVNFKNRWMELHGDQHLDELEACMMIFHHEYDEVWTGLVDRLEVWIVENDTRLESAKLSAPPERNYPTRSTIFPICPELSIRRCASAA